MTAVTELNCDLQVPLAPSPAVSESAAPGPAESSSPVLERLLQMADSYGRNRALKQATEMYFQLAESHAGSREGRQARARLMEMSAEYERRGQLRQARSIYERLL